MKIYVLYVDNREDDCEASPEFFKAFTTREAAEIFIQNSDINRAIHESDLHGVYDDHEYRVVKDDSCGEEWRVEDRDCNEETIQWYKENHPEIDITAWGPSLLCCIRIYEMEVEE